MERALSDSIRWSAEGTRLLVKAVSGLDEDGYARPTALPGWTRRHVVGHVAANADALGNLVRWAATGVETPMYASPEERVAGIERAAAMSATNLETRLTESAARLTEAMDRLTDEQWRRPVVTAQGRTVAATELPWMRAREVCVHAVDLDLGITFADLPEGFLTELREEIRTKRGLDVVPSGPLPEVTAWLAGRPHSLTDALRLDPWL
ncbi:maleylpyruvate isomerase family mycothiol-dependent enzyme [Nocardiopsis sp. ARC36]